MSDLYQYSIDYTVGSRGKLLKKAKKVDCGSMEVSIAACENGDAIWEAGDFYIVDDYFVDCKFDGGKEDKKG